MKKEVKAFFKAHPSLKLKTKEIAKHLGVAEEYEYAELKHVLHKLTDEGYLEKAGKRYKINIASPDKLIGIVQIVNEGDYAFVRMNNSSIKDVFVAGKNLNTAFDGDLVEIKLFAKKTGKSMKL